MPVTLTAMQHPAPVVIDTEETCANCLGALECVDDGELTGTPGALVPCGCVSYCSCPDCVAGRSAGGCPCLVPGWPHNDGHAGWVQLPLEEIEENGPFFRPCAVHPPGDRR